MELVRQQARITAATWSGGEDRTRAAWDLFLDATLAQKERFLKALAGFDLNPPQAYLLRALTPGAATPMCRLAHVLGCDASNVTNLADRLEDRGLVERQAEPADRRVKNLVLTADGARLRARLLREAFAPPQWFSALPATTVASLEKVLERIVAERRAPGDCDGHD